MFGYIKTDHPNLYVKDTVLYRAMYCGLCKSICEICGQTPRLVLSYDLAFLSVLCHNILNIDVNITKQRCVIHWFGGHPIAETDDLSRRIGALNVILAYHKLADDVLDDNKGRVKKGFFKRAYKKCAKLEPEFDRAVTKMYDKLLRLERENCDSIDIVSDPFGEMMQKIVKLLLGDKADDNILNLSYNLGKWIYLIDALDDFDKDKKKKNYNVFSCAYPNVLTKEQLLKDSINDLLTVFGTIIVEIENSAKQIKYNFNHDLVDNIFMLGIKKQTKIVMENKKCKNTTKY